MKDIDKIPLTELGGNFQTYEMRLGLMEKDEKSRNLALKDIEEEIVDSEDEDESEDECKDFGHMRIKYLNYLMKEKTKKSKDKGLVATWSDTENDSSNEYVDECNHVMAFTASTNNVIVESASNSEDFSNDEVPKKMTLQYALNL